MCDRHWGMRPGTPCLLCLGEQLAEKDRIEEDKKLAKRGYILFGSIRYLHLTQNQPYSAREEDTEPLCWRTARGGWVPYYQGKSMCMVSGWVNFQAPLMSIDPPFASFVATDKDNAEEAAVGAEIEGIPEIRFGDRDRAIVWARDLDEASQLARQVLERHPLWKPIGQAPEPFEVKPDPTKQIKIQSEAQKAAERQRLAEHYRWGVERPIEEIFGAERMTPREDTKWFDPQPYTLDGGRRDRNLLCVFKVYGKRTRHMDGARLWNGRAKVAHRTITAPRAYIKDRIKELT